MTRLLVGFLLGSMATPALAGQLLLGWDFPRASEPQPVSFQLSYTTSAAPEAVIEAMTVAPSAIGACEALTDATADTYCALWPVCPASGTVILFWVQAIWQDHASTRSNILLCWFSAAHPCECQDPAQHTTTDTTTGGETTQPQETTPAYWTKALDTILRATPTQPT